MSLVDYASSDDEQEQQQENPSVEIGPLHQSTSSTPHNHPQPQQQQLASSTSSPSPSLPPQSNRSSSSVSTSLPQPFEKLPDASLLLNSPMPSQSVGADHSARVAAAMAENASRKREANGSGSASVRGKIPRGDLPHSKNIPDTSSGLLMPPQLRGRSNVVTEDISKLFVQRNKEKS